MTVMRIPVFEELKTTIMTAGVPFGYLCKESRVDPDTVKGWLSEKTFIGRIDTMWRVADVLGRHVELPPHLRKMVDFYGRRRRSLQS